MSKFMSWMRLELEGIKASEIKPNNHEVEDGDEVIGVLTDIDLQKLSVLHGRLVDQMRALLKEHAHLIIELAGEEDKPDHNQVTCKRCTMDRNLSMLNDKKDAVGALFWTGLRHELSDEGLIKLHKAGGTIGICKDWKIVACRQSKSSLLAALLALGLPIPI